MNNGANSLKQTKGGHSSGSMQSKSGTSTKGPMSSLLDDFAKLKLSHEKRTDPASKPHDACQDLVWDHTCGIRMNSAAVLKHFTSDKGHCQKLNDCLSRQVERRRLAAGLAGLDHYLIPRDPREFRGLIRSRFQIGERVVRLDIRGPFSVFRSPSGGKQLSACYNGRILLKCEVKVEPSSAVASQHHKSVQNPIQKRADASENAEIWLRHSFPGQTAIRPVKGVIMGANGPLMSHCDVDLTPHTYGHFSVILEALVVLRIGDSIQSAVHIPVRIEIVAHEPLVLGRFQYLASLEDRAVVTKIDDKKLTCDDVPALDKIFKTRHHHLHGPYMRQFYVLESSWESEVRLLQSRARGAHDSIALHNLVAVAPIANSSRRWELSNFVGLPPAEIFKPLPYTAANAPCLVYRDLALEFVANKKFCTVELKRARVADVSKTGDMIHILVPVKNLIEFEEAHFSGILVSGPNVSEMLLDIEKVVRSENKGMRRPPPPGIYCTPVRKANIPDVNLLKALNSFKLIPRQNVLAWAMTVISCIDDHPPSKYMGRCPDSLEMGVRRAFDLIFPRSTRLNPPPGTYETVFPGLNPLQAKAVAQVVVQKHGLTVVKGPPGTGKTATCTRAILETLRQTCRATVVAVANTNSAVDTIVLRLIKEFDEEEGIELDGSATEESSSESEAQRLKRFGVLRIYSASAARTTFPETEGSISVTSVVTSDLSEVESAAHGLGTDYRVLATTLDSLISRIPMLLSHAPGAVPFELLVLDEAGRVPLARAMAGFSVAKRLMLLGDEDQMAPYVAQNLGFLRQFGLDHSVMAYARQANQLQRIDCTVCLTRNYRSIKQILKPLNVMVYNDCPLSAAKHEQRMNEVIALCSEFGFLKRLFPAGPGIAVVPVEGATLQFPGSTSSTNPTEVSSMLAILRAFASSGLQKRATVGIITFYADQELLLLQAMAADLVLKNDLNWITTGTTERQQGREFDFVLISGTKASSGDALDASDATRSNGIGFLNDKKRLNVALSRARLGVVVLLRPPRFCRDSKKLWSTVLCQAVKDGQVVQEPTFHASPRLADELKQWAKSYR